jgi:hypothetical protein
MSALREDQIDVRKTKPQKILTLEVGKIFWLRREFTAQRRFRCKILQAEFISSNST